MPLPRWDCCWQAAIRDSPSPRLPTPNLVGSNQLHQLGSISPGTTSSWRLD